MRTWRSRLCYYQGGRSDQRRRCPPVGGRGGRGGREITGQCGAESGAWRGSVADIHSADTVQGGLSDPSGSGQRTDDRRLCCETPSRPPTATSSHRILLTSGAQTTERFCCDSGRKDCSDKPHREVAGRSFTTCIRKPHREVKVDLSLLYEVYHCNLSVPFCSRTSLFFVSHLKEGLGACYAGGGEWALGVSQHSRLFLSFLISPVLRDRISLVRRLNRIIDSGLP